MMEKKTVDCYPIYLKLKDKPCLVVGAGKVASRKVSSLLRAGAAVTVVSPEATEELRQAAAGGKITWNKKCLDDLDIEGAFLVVGATGNRELNERIYRLGESRGVMVNIVDEPELCSFFVPAVMRRGPFQIAVSSGGSSPYLARRVREELESRFGPEYEEIVGQMGLIRKWLKEKLPDQKKRRRFWEEFVDLDYFDSLEEGDISTSLKERAESCLSRLVD